MVKVVKKKLVDAQLDIAIAQLSVFHEAFHSNRSTAAGLLICERPDGTRYVKLNQYLFTSLAVNRPPKENKKPATWLIHAPSNKYIAVCVGGRTHRASF